MVKHPPTMWETRVQSLGQEDPLKKEMATNSSILAWKIPWMEEPGWLLSMGSQRVRHDWATSLSIYLSKIYKQLIQLNIKKKRNKQDVNNRSIQEKGRWSEVAQSCPTLHDPIDCSLPGSFIHGIFQARILELVAISFPKGFFQPRSWTRISCTAGRLFTVWATREPPKYG